MSSRANRVIAEFKRRGLTVAVAESFTGGLVMDALVRVAGASDAFVGGVVAYSDAAKVSILSVPKSLLAEHGAVSGPVARAMAKGARKAFGADIGVATTGIAGPTGATRGKPVGLSFAAAAGSHGTRVTRRVHRGGRATVRRAGADQAIDALLSLLWSGKRG